MAEAESQHPVVADLSDEELRDEINERARDLHQRDLYGRYGDMLSDICHPADERSDPPDCLSGGSGGHDSVMDEAIGWANEYSDLDMRSSGLASRFAALCEEAQRRHHASAGQSVM